MMKHIEKTITALIMTVILIVIISLTIRGTYRLLMWLKTPVHFDYIYLSFSVLLASLIIYAKEDK